MAPERMLLGVCAVLMVVGVTNAAEGQVASVVVGLARCADSTRKNMKAEAGFKGKHAARRMRRYVTRAVCFLLCMHATRNAIHFHACYGFLYL
jgi:hypothetical protein